MDNLTTSNDCHFTHHASTDKVIIQLESQQRMFAMRVYKTVLQLFCLPDNLLLVLLWKLVNTFIQPWQVNGLLNFITTKTKEHDQQQAKPLCHFVWVFTYNEVWTWGNEFLNHILVAIWTWYTMFGID